MPALKCKCGYELGEVTSNTKGLCPKCQTSIWMQVARLEQPDSESIANKLNTIRSSHCACKGMLKSPCYSHCGVIQNENGWWIPITPQRRQEWFDRVMK